MINSVTITSYGRPATDALAGVIAGAKAHHGPLAPVTVIVPSNLAGLSARRILGRRSGLANVQFVTPFRFAELLSADVLTERRPLTNPILGAAVRTALREGHHPFGDTSDHRATEEAVASLYATLSHVSPAALAAIGRHDWGAVMVRLYQRVGRLVAAYDDDNDVARSARDRDDLDAALRPFGTLVWHLPEPLTHELGELLRSSFDRAPATVVVGLSGDTDADDDVRRACGQVGAVVDGDRSDAVGSPPIASALISVTDADEEVREVISSVWRLAELGTPLHRIVVAYPARSPYLRTLHAQLSAAGMPFNGPSPSSIADTAAGSALLAALGLDGVDWRRDRVMALVAAGPVRHRGGPAKPAAWERVSRAAGVVAGHADWERKLTAWHDYCTRKAAGADRTVEHSDSEEDRSDGVVEAGAHSARRWRDDAEVAVSLRSFVAEVAALVDAVTSAEGWSRRADATIAMLESLFGGRRSRWPDAELDAYDRVIGALARLHQLDLIEPEPDMSVFVRAVESELAAPAPRVGTYGTGVTVVPLAAAVGLDVDAVFVVGMAEGLCPSGRLDNALLAEALAETTAGEVATPTQRLHVQHRRLLAALAGAPQSSRTMTFARGDLRTSRKHLPSRWLLDTASALAGKTVQSDRLYESGVVTEVPSFDARIRGGAVAASDVEHDLALVVVAPDPVGHPAIGTAARGIAAQRARRSSEFTEWDGNLAGRFVRSPADDNPMSPTRLESWAACGLRYFFAYVLGLHERDDPERITELGALDKGNVLHKVLEDFVREALDAGTVPAPGWPWSESQRRRIHEIGDDRFDRLERAGKTGRALLWTEQRRALHESLDRFLTVDDDRRAVRGTTPDEVERAFGIDGVEPLSVALADGRSLRFRGRIDRIDRTVDGSPVVYDYKSGSGSKYKSWNEDEDAVFAGTVLQPAIYSEVVREPSSDADIEASLWMLEPKDFDLKRVTMDTGARRRFLDVATTIVDGIEAGAFPAVPGEWNAFFRTHSECRYCAFDTVCPVDRGEEAEAKSASTEPFRAGLGVVAEAEDVT